MSRYCAGTGPHLLMPQSPESVRGVHRRRELPVWSVPDSPPLRSMGDRSRVWVGQSKERPPTRNLSRIPPLPAPRGPFPNPSRDSHGPRRRGPPGRGERGVPSPRHSGRIVARNDRAVSTLGQEPPADPVPMRARSSGLPRGGIYQRRGNCRHDLVWLLDRAPRPPHAPGSSVCARPIGPNRTWTSAATWSRRFPAPRPSRVSPAKTLSGPTRRRPRPCRPGACAGRTRRGPGSATRR